MQEIRKLFHKSLEAFPDLIFLVSHDGMYLDYLGNEKNLFVPPEEFIGKKITDVMPKRIAKLQINAIRKTSETKQMQTIELSLPIRNQTRYFESRFIYFSKDHIIASVRDITKRKLTEQKLKESEEKYKTILDGIVNGVWVTDKDDIIYYTNKGMEKIAGIPSEQIVNANVLIDFPESTLQYFRPYYLKAKNSLKKVFYDAVPVETPAGRQSFQSGWLIPREKEGKYDGIICTVEDITERKQVEQKLRKSEELFRDFFDSAAIGFHIFGPDRIITEMNEYELNLLGYSREEIVNKKTWYDFIIPEQRHQFEKQWNNILNKGQVNNLEYTLIHKDGHFIDVLLNASSRFDDNDNLINTRGSVLNITERKQVEQKLRKSEENLKQFNEKLEQMINERTRELKELEEKCHNLIENIPDAIYSALPDETGSATFVSNRWKDWTGYSPEDFYKDHETWPKSIHQEDRDGIIKKYIDAVKEKTEYTLEYRVVHKETGEIRYVRDRGVPIFDEKGNISRFDGVVSDITENKETEQIIRKSKEKYEEAYNRMIFYQDLIAHDINNVLNVLNTSAELLSRYKKDYEFGKDVNNEINRIKVQVDKGANLIRNIRKLSKLEDRCNILEDTDVNFIMEKSIDFTKKVFHQRKINCKVESVEKHLIVKANELLSDIFENILNNAVKYNNNQTVDIIIKIDKKVKEKERCIKIEFNDNGIGISDTRKPIIFQKGFIKEKYSKGMGLGLSLIKKIIQSYCGIIKVKNRIKGDYTKGSRFIIYIPEAL